MNKLITTSIFILATASLFAQPQRFRGYPEKSPSNLSESFKTPPRGYGNVPFYWWQGDSISPDRLRDQLDILYQAAIDGFAVSYAHTDPRVDPEMAINGYGFAGNTEPGAPQLFGEQWWQTWKWYAQECAKYDVGVGMDDYTYGWPNNGYFPDQIRDMPQFANYQGNLKIDIIELNAGQTIEQQLPQTFISATAWPGKIDLAQFAKSGTLKWRAPTAAEGCKVYIISTEKGFAIHPQHGQTLVDIYFEPFRKRLSDEEFESMNYFFQDELTYPITMLSWSEDFQAEFTARKGYNITPYLPALVDNIGPETAKARLDYCQVLLDLAEERYFKPIYNWHAEKGLIYGSDNHGRGKDVLAYVDYFRANSWYTAPGNDAPARGSSFIETKVSSSISHLYDRPRTWLEAFHSMGWSSTGAWLTEQIDHHFIAGGNLVCMHGLYYSTHGGWWEWAPPCFHFRMPYWPHMIDWLNYTERMSYILSQGTHKCDIAIMYPTESMQAFANADASVAFDLAMNLSDHGLDYDFMHYQHLGGALTTDGELIVGNESYKILILADLRACHSSTLQKALDHFRSGGIVLTTGRLPEATTAPGGGKTELQKAYKELFGTSPEELLPNQTAENSNSAGGHAAHLPADKFVEHIKTLITPDFSVQSANNESARANGELASSPSQSASNTSQNANNADQNTINANKNASNQGEGKVLHRKIGDKDLYMVANVKRGDRCFFRAQGHVELWNAATGEKTDLPVYSQDKSGTFITMTKEQNQSYLIVFSPGEPTIDQSETIAHLDQTIPLEGNWRVEFLPTMDNKWGDYRLPATNEIIGPEARVFKYKMADKRNSNWKHESFDDSLWRESIYGYGIQAEALDLDSLIDFNNAVAMACDGENQPWAPYEFSWQYGVWDNPGSQGFHGLKSRVSDELFILNNGAHQFFRTNVWINSPANYTIVTQGREPDLLLVDKTATTSGNISLTKGWHSLLLGYSSTPKLSYQKSPFDFDPRQRAMVAILPQGTTIAPKSGMYDHIVSTIWGKTEHINYSPYPSNDGNRWLYRAETVPGVQSIALALHGKIEGLWLSGYRVKDRYVKLLSSENGINNYLVTLPEVHPGIETMAIEIDAHTGFQGAAVFSEPVKFSCVEGEMEAGNWADKGSMRYYSGGVYYRKSFQIAVADSLQKTELALGNVIATCQVKVNNELVGIMMAPPYTIDISKYICLGKNEVEILVYSTLSNHYQTVPSFYRGKPDAGLLGPVSINIYRMEEGF